MTSVNNGEFPTEFEKTAEVHPATVEAIAKDSSIIERSKPKREHIKKHPTHNTEVGHIKVDKRVWRKVMELSHGDMSRVEIRSETVVTIHNNANWR